MGGSRAQPNLKKIQKKLYTIHHQLRWVGGFPTLFRNFTLESFPLPTSPATMARPEKNCQKKLEGFQSECARCKGTLFLPVGNRCISWFLSSVQKREDGVYSFLPFLSFPVVINFCCCCLSLSLLARCRIFLHEATLITLSSSLQIQYSTV